VANGLHATDGVGSRRILVPVDFSPRSRVALRWAVDLAHATGASIDLLHVTSALGRVQLALDAYLGRPFDITPADVVGRVREDLSLVAESVPHEGVAVSLRLEAGSPAATIVRVATEEAVDLIVLCTRGRYGLAELVFGSVARDLMSCSPCPLTLLRIDEPAAAP
jgi:nucleotide-binding universal stress UspA family protein